MPDLKVQTSQNVLLEYPVGNIGQRILAGLLDLAVLILYVLLARFIFAKLLSVELFGDDVGILEFFIVILPTMIYLPASEYLWNGKTVGKAILKLKVVRVDGSAPSLGDIVLRWLIRTIDVKLGFLFIFFIPRTPSSDTESVLIALVIIFFVLPMPIVGILSMAFSKTRQRLGDRIANTAVIMNKRPFSLDDTILQATEDDYQPVFKNALKLRDRDFYIIKQALEEVEKTQDYKNVKILGEKAKELLDIQDTKMTPLQILKTLVKDYNHLSKK